MSGYRSWIWLQSPGIDLSDGTCWPLGNIRPKDVQPSLRDEMCMCSAPREGEARGGKQDREEWRRHCPSTTQPHPRFELTPLRLRFIGTWKSGPRITSHRSQWPSPKSLQITNAGENVEKKELYYTVSKNENWCSHYGEHYGGSLKNWK